ncbi:hypothetical protein ACRRTK_021878 [Alexandromys fortis]
MIAAAFLVLLRPYSIQCALFLLLLLLGTIATIIFFCCWHRKLQKGRHPMKSVFSGRSRSRGKGTKRVNSDQAVPEESYRKGRGGWPASSQASEKLQCGGGIRSYLGFRASPRHIRRRVAAAAAAAARLEEVKPVVEVHHQSEQESSGKKRRIKKNSRVQPEFYHSVQGARRPEYQCGAPLGFLTSELLLPARNWFTECENFDSEVSKAIEPEGILHTSLRSDQMVIYTYTVIPSAGGGTETRSIIIGPSIRAPPHHKVDEDQSSGNASYRCSMSSSADFSDEDDFSQKSGSASPAPGDTLPWNLPKHERSKRKIHGGSVLDPAERAVLRIAVVN